MPARLSSSDISAVFLYISFARPLASIFSSRHCLLIFSSTESPLAIASLRNSLSGPSALKTIAPYPNKVSLSIFFKPTASGNTFVGNISAKSEIPSISFFCNSSLINLSAQFLKKTFRVAILFGERA